MGFAVFEIRARRREQHARNYLDGIVWLIDDAQLIIEHKELLPLHDYSPVDIQAKTYSQLTEEQKIRAHYCDSIIARGEPVWLASEENWVARDEWPYWRVWLQQLARSADFRRRRRPEPFELPPGSPTDAALDRVTLAGYGAGRKSVGVNGAGLMWVAIVLFNDLRVSKQEESLASTSSLLPYSRRSSVARPERAHTALRWPQKP